MLTRRPLVPAGFAVPQPPDDRRFRFEVLGPEHAAADLDAWSCSIEHIRRTPGFDLCDWPDKPVDLPTHRQHLTWQRELHQHHLQFAWTVLHPQYFGYVLGRVQLQADNTRRYDAEALSWVRGTHAQLDCPLRTYLRSWLTVAWPLRIRYALRKTGFPTPRAQP